MSPKYRPNVAIIITDGQGRVLLCYRGQDTAGPAQTVQGGIDPGETPIEAAIRELYEEVGLLPHEYEFLAASDAKYRYDWPADFLKELEHQMYVGQEQQFFLVQVDPDAEFKLDTHVKEFEIVKWGTPEELLSLAWERKRPGLEGALKEFGLLVPQNA